MISDPSAAAPAWKTAIKGIAGALGYGSGNNHYPVKRVIGTPGDTVSCCDQQGKLLVNGVPIDEPYVYQDLPFVPGSLDCHSEPVSTRCFASVSVPAGHLLALGAHRSNSSDSVIACRGRSPDAVGNDCVRWAKTDRVAGHVFAVIWPLDHFGGRS